jgi:transmembrane sensor
MAERGNMQNDQFSGNSSDIRSEACAWIAQLETGDLKRADIDAFREWTQRSPRHAAEIRKLAHLSADLNVLTALAGPMKAAAARHAEAVGSKGRRGWNALHGLAATAVAAILALTLLVLKPFSTVSEPEWPMVLATGIGEYLEQQLPDGSLVALNTDTKLHVTYTAEHRHVELLQGEALFTVKRDPQKPFVVFTGDKSVEAIGTVFLVRNDAQAFEVAVTEGRVKLTDTNDRTSAGDSTVLKANSDRPSRVEKHTPQNLPDQIIETGPIAPVMLDAGQHLSVHVQNTAVNPPQPAIEVISPIDLRRKLAWRDGLLDFSDTPLEEVIREVSRHTTTRIEIADPALAEVRFGGVFRAGDTEPLFRALESAYHINAEYIDRDTVRLTRSGLN